MTCLRTVSLQSNQIGFSANKITFCWQILLPYILLFPYRLSVRKPSSPNRSSTTWNVITMLTFSWYKRSPQPDGLAAACRGSCYSKTVSIIWYSDVSIWLTLEFVATTLHCGFDCSMLVTATLRSKGMFVVAIKTSFCIIVHNINVLYLPQWCKKIPPCCMVAGILPRRLGFNLC